MFSFHISPLYLPIFTQHIYPTFVPKRTWGVASAEATAVYYALDDCSLLYLQPNMDVVKPGCRGLAGWH